jgi:hypothetical protein
MLSSEGDNDSEEENKEVSVLKTHLYPSANSCKESYHNDLPFSQRPRMARCDCALRYGDTALRPPTSPDQ